MNVTLLCMVFPLVCILFWSDMCLFLFYEILTEEDKDGMFGGLGRKGIVFQIWCTTFVLSSVGLCCSFYLHVFFSSGPLVILVFVLINTALAVFNEGFCAQNTTVVLLCLITIVMCYVSLFGYTLYHFPVYDTSIHNAALLWITHICNGICILHALFLDLLIWQRGWWQYLRKQLNNDNDIETEHLV
jgi:hypothetical protein